MNQLLKKLAASPVSDKAASLAAINPAVGGRAGRCSGQAGANNLGRAAESAQRGFKIVALKAFEPVEGDGFAYERRGRRDTGQWTVSVATSFQFGSRARGLRAKVHKSTIFAA